jgi:hypothetical protein|tara:strand:+ start:1217 stop:1531 length:315 start_codon:yes stop_codon:yes gene_type:complete
MKKKSSKFYNVEVLQKETKGFKVLNVRDFLKKDFPESEGASERGYRRGYRRGYSQGIDDMYFHKSYNKLCKFFDKFIMPWSYFKGKYKDKKGAINIPPDYKGVK